MGEKSVLPSRADDFPGWYQALLTKAQLAENGPARGTMVIRPYGYAIWELMQADLDARFKREGVENAYFPLLFPLSYIEREAEHVDGFSPELAVVTHAGGAELAEPLVIRPTSETVIGESMSRWIQSYRDLPLLLNQWANVVRWEMRPRLLLRTTEFLWQEGHTAHASEAEAHDFALRILRDAYADFMIQALAIPVFPGRKTPGERFAGAINSMTCEGMMGDGKALQMGTSHELGQNFARAFEIDFLDNEGQRALCWTTSWGVSTRMLGGVIMAHGDDAGLRLPPAIAPIQVVVLVVRDEGTVRERAVEIVEELKRAGVRVRLDDSTDTAFGRRTVDWELKGVPIRLELGPRDLEANEVVVARRIDRTKDRVALSGAAQHVVALLSEIQTSMLADATEHRDQRVIEMANVDAALELPAGVWARIPASTLGDDGEKRLNDASLSIRCLQRPDGTPPAADDEPEAVALVARAY